LQFKVPSLRNLKFSFPYMHDGRFASLGEVIKHYTDGVVKASTTSIDLQKGINLDGRQRTDLLAFLLTLNDEEFVFDKQHQYPRAFLHSTE